MGYPYGTTQHQGRLKKLEQMEANAEHLASHEPNTLKAQIEDG